MLLEKCLRLFEIIGQASTYSFMICLPRSMCTVYLVFHVSMLELVISNTFHNWFKLSLPLVVIDGIPEYGVFQIVNSKIDCKHICKLLYKVIWLEYQNIEEESDWLPVWELAHAPDPISSFYQAYSGKSGPLSLLQLYYPSKVVTVCGLLYSP